MGELVVKIKMNKKGQFYLLTAVILATVLWASLPQHREQTIVRTTFDVLRENFITESPNVINYALSNEKNLTETYKIFVEDFIRYAETKQVEFGVTYLIRTPDYLEVGNYLGEPVKVEVYGEVETLESGELGTYRSAPTATVYIEDTPFRYEFDNDPVQFKALFKQIS